MVGGGINDWKFFLFVGVVDGCVYFILFLFFRFVAVGGVDSGGF